MEGVQRYRVRLLPHNERWAAEFQETKALLERLWPNVLDIQQIGSTAVRGILAKPILDVAVVLPSLEEMDADALVRAGYDDCGPQAPDYDRHLFVKRGENQVSLQHIHCYGPGSRDFERCVGFRDYLNSHPEAAREYSRLKEELARRYPDDRIAYTNGKEEFIQSIYARLK